MMTTIDNGASFATEEEEGTSTSRRSNSETKTKRYPARKSRSRNVRVYLFLPDGDALGETNPVVGVSHARDVFELRADVTQTRGKEFVHELISFKGPLTTGGDGRGVTAEVDE